MDYLGLINLFQHHTWINMDYLQITSITLDYPILFQDFSDHLTLDFTDVSGVTTTPLDFTCQQDGFIFQLFQLPLNGLHMDLP